jgi:hypothetical protein
MSNSKADEAKRDVMVDDDEPDEWFVFLTPLPRISPLADLSFAQG